MTLQTKLPGSAIQSGSIPVTAITNFSGELSASLPPNVVSSSAQVKTFLPMNTVSSSAQVTAFLPTGTVSSSTQLPSGIASSSAQVTAYLPTGTVSSSGQVTALLPANTVSSSGQISLSGISGTTFSNNDFSFPLNVTVNGLLTATSQSIIYITSSQLNVGSNDIILNTSEQLRYGGLTVFDSGSANQSGSLLWDSLHNVWLYVHAGTSNTSSIVITGPENTGVLGSETFLTPNLLPKAGLVGDHIVDSQISDNGTTVGMTGNLSVTGSLTVATNALFVSSSGNVGIGTTNPGYKLVAEMTSASDRFQIQRAGNSKFIVDGDGIIKWGSNADYGGLTWDSGRAVVYAQGGLALSLGANGANYYVNIDTSGNVGIGTTSPSAKLETVGEIRTSGASGILIAADRSTSGFAGLYRTAGVNRLWDGAAGDVITWNSSGNVGIGTTSPTYKLHVLAADTSNTFPTSASINVTNSNSAAFSRTMGINFSVGAGATAEIISGVYGVYTNYNTSVGGALVFTTNNGSGSLSEKVRIDATGNVGIGTTSPQTALHLIGNMTMGDTTYSRPALKSTYWGYSASYRVLMVGSSSTSYATQHTGAVTMAFNYDPSGNANGSFNGDGREIIFRRGTQFVTPNAADTSFNLYNLVLLDGNVGIGTASPSYKLDVVGDIHSTSELYLDNGYYLRFKRSSGGLSIQTLGIPSGTDDVRLLTTGDFNLVNGSLVNLMTVKNGGNVGIGTTNPKGKLAVEGVALIGETNSGAYVTPSKLHIAGTGTGQMSFEDIGISTAGIALDGTNFSIGHQDATVTYYFRYSNTYNGDYANTGTVLAAFNKDNSYVIGNVGIGTTNPGSYKLQVQGDTYVTGTLTEGSSIALKKNINPITDALNIINNLTGYTFDRTDSDATNQAGLIAEEVAEVLPGVVSRDQEGNPSGVQYTKIIAYLVESIKELKSELDELKRQ